MRIVLLFSFFSFYLVGYGQIIDFPDANFKNALLNSKCVFIDEDVNPDSDADLNNDGEIDLNEAQQVIRLTINEKKIYNLEGLENFTNLTYLECTFNNLSTLNLQDLKNLQTLYCSHNMLSNLNVTGLKNLINLHCDWNLLTELNLQGLTSLFHLDCSYNRLTSLDLNGLVKLSKIYCYKNQLTSLELHNLPNLTFIQCNMNSLVSLDFEAVANLESVICSNNQLANLNFKELPKLKTLSFSNNKLTSLDVTGLLNLKNLDCSDNKLVSLDIKGPKINQQFLSFHNNPNLEYICCNENNISEIKNMSISNGQNCEVNSYCTFTPGGKFYLINGKNNYDGNLNGCEDQDIKVPNIKYHITKGNISGFFVTNSTGNYSIPVQNGTHTITPILENPNHFEVTPSSFSVTFPNTSDTITQDFCIAPNGIFRQTNITVIPLSPPARPGFDAKYKIVWENVGNQIESGRLNFTYDEIPISGLHTNLNEYISH